jgi:hypothetical protein
VIVANIGGDAFALASIADAHQLLEILERAKLVEEGTVSQNYDRRYFLTDGFRRDTEIKIVAHEALTREEFNQLREKNGVPA